MVRRPVGREGSAGQEDGSTAVVPQVKDATFPTLLRTADAAGGEARDAGIATTPVGAGVAFRVTRFSPQRGREALPDPAGRSAAGAGPRRSRRGKKGEPPMTRINTNIASLRGLRSLNKATNALDQAMTRLSTGLKINSGRDNPSGLIASESLRVQVAAIEQSIKNSNRANNVIATADSALGEIGGLLTQIRGLVQEGLNTGALSRDEIEANQLQIDNALSAINKIASNTMFAGDKLIDGTKSFVTTITNADAAKLSDYTVNEAVLGTSGPMTLEAEVTQVAERGRLMYSGGDFTEKGVLEIGGSKGSEVVFLGETSSVAHIADGINSATDSTGVIARIMSGYTQAVAATAGTATLDSAAADGDVTFTAVTAGTAQNISIEFVDPGANTSPLGVTTTVNGSDITISVSLETDGAGALISTSADVAAAITGDATASQYVTAAAEGAGTGVVDAIAATALAGATDAGTFVLSDLRTPGTAGVLSLALTDPAAASQALSVTVTQTGDDYAIDVSLATDGTGAIISTLDDIAAAINADPTLAGIVAATTSGDGTAVGAAVAATNLSEATGGAIALESLDYGADEFVNVSVLEGAFDTTLGDGLSESRRDHGVDIGVTINGQQAVGHGLRATLRASRVDAAMTFEEASNVVGETVSLTIQGGGAVFQIGQEVSAAGQIGIGIDAVNTARLGGISGKLYELGSGAGRSLIDVTRGDANGADVVAILEEAIKEVSTLRGRLGAVQKNVIDTNVATLGVALENIAEARSQIVDTDFAEETANLTKAQVLSQAGISVLAIANQNPQQVLALLG
jgi:flagellin